MKKNIIIVGILIISIGFYSYIKGHTNNLSSTIQETSEIAKNKTEIVGSTTQELPISSIVSKAPTTTKRAIIKSFTVKQNQSEKYLPFVFADLSWEVTNADSVSIDFLHCPEGVKIFLVSNHNMSNVCNQKVVLFDDSHTGSTTVIAVDTNLSTNTSNNNLIVDLALMAQNFSNNQSNFTTSQQDEIYLSKRQIGDIGSYPQLSDIDGAEATLKEYFKLISTENFNKALLYIPAEDNNLYSFITAHDYSLENPFSGVKDALRSYLCEIGYACDVTISKVITRKDIGGGVFEFVVSFVTKDNKEFHTPGICYEHEANAPCPSGTSEYTYKVKKVGPNTFNIIDKISGPFIGQ